MDGRLQATLIVQDCCLHLLVQQLAMASAIAILAAMSPNREE